MRKTKIICTLGPSVGDEGMIKKLVLNGMNAARFNFSHGTHESHLRMLETLKSVREELNAPVATILDTKGPEIRIKSFKNGSVELKPGARFTLTVDDVAGDETRVSVTYKNLHREIKKGERILLDDGLIELRVIDISDNDIVCIVQNGGVISDNKGINTPDTDEICLRLPKRY